MKLILAYAGMIALTVCGNLLLKLGAVSAASRPDEGLERFLNAYVFGGVASFAAAAAAYLIVLQWLPLNVAQSYLSAQFVAVVLAAALILSEPIGGGQWAGIALIAAGIFLVGHAAP